MQADGIDQIIESLREDPTTLSAQALASLSDLDRESEAHVLEVLGEIDFEYRRIIVNQLAELAEENLEYSFDGLFMHLLDDEDEEVREAAITGLWECEERRLIEPLFERLQNDEDERVRAGAALALGRFAVRAELGELLERDANRLREGLLEVIRNELEPSFDVRRRVIEAVAPFGIEEVRQLILENYESANETMRASALYAMGQNAHVSWLPYIREEMESESPEVRFEAAGAAGRMGAERLIPALARMGAEDASEVQDAVVTALSAIGGPTAQRVLRRFLQHSDEHYRELALDALENMQSFEANNDILRKSGGGQDPATPGVLGSDEDDVFENFDDDLGIDEELDEWADEDDDY